MVLELSGHAANVGSDPEGIPMRLGQIQSQPLLGPSRRRGLGGRGSTRPRLRRGP
jgi:hypothetical protein